MADVMDLSLDELIRLNYLGTESGYRSRSRSCSRSRSTSRSARSRSLRREFVNQPGSRSRSPYVSHSPPVYVDGSGAHRSRSRSRQSRSRSRQSRSRSRQSRSRSRQSRSRSRQLDRFNTIESEEIGQIRGRSRSVNNRSRQTGQFARSRSCEGNPTTAMSYRSDNIYGWLHSTPHPVYPHLHHYENVCTYSPKYVQVTNQPQARIWRPKVNQFYPGHRSNYFEKVKALQQLRIAQQRVRQAKKLLNDKVILYQRLQMCPQNVLICGQSTSGSKPINFLQSGKQNGYPSFRYQNRNTFDLEGYSDGELSVTIQNDLARKRTDSPANSIQTQMIVLNEEDSHGFGSVGGGSSHWKLDDYESSIS